jgi:chaperonin GroES
MANSLKPLGDRVIVKPKAKEEMTRSGIVLPDTASEKPQEGSVLAVGPGRMLDTGKRVDMEVKSGDTVLFANTPARKSSSTARTTSSSAKATCSRSSPTAATSQRAEGH